MIFVIESILDFYNEYRHLIQQQDNGWEKLNQPWSFDTVKNLDSIISPHVDTSHNLGDNIYKHTFPYFWAWMVASRSENKTIGINFCI